MKPVAFDYLTPTSVKETLTVLEDMGDRAKIIAGGQSLVPMMNFRLARPEILIDINRLAELSYIREENGALVIGALTRQRDVETSPTVRRACPLLSDAVSYVAHAAIRNRGTIGGSIVHADPAAEIATVLMALEGSIKIADSTGERTVDPEAFFLTYLTTTLAPNEMVVEVSFPIPPPGAGWGFAEISRRHGDFALAAVGAMLRLDQEGHCDVARIALGGVAPTPVRAVAAEEMLLGSECTAEVIEAAAQAVRQACDTDSDYHASAEYREHLAVALTRQSLDAALAKCPEGSP